MKRFVLLLAVALVFLVACGAVESVVDETTTTTEPTTAEVATTEAPFEYIYLTDAEIWRFLGSAARVFNLFVRNDLGLLVDDDEESAHGFHRVTDPELQTIADLENLLHEYFSAALVQEILANSAARYTEFDGQLYAVACSGRGGTPYDLDFVRIEEQTATRVRYRKQISTSFDDIDDWHAHFTRELIDGRWIFTEFPGWF
ncbi:MAG: hypothetical protein FWB76_01900 [Oscillospiraceae bacterium]|nr:hypothetical protein [Oscillospiraceae bacterium]